MNLKYEPKKIYDVTKSQEAFKRALKVVPAGIYGHLGPSEGCMIPVSSYPLFMSKAKGAYFWDIDGNRFIDYMCAYGPNFLGYNDPDVDAAAIEQLKKATAQRLLPNCSSTSRKKWSTPSTWQTGRSSQRTAATQPTSRS